VNLKINVQEGDRDELVRLLRALPPAQYFMNYHNLATGGFCFGSGSPDEIADTLSQSWWTIVSLKVGVKRGG
jgi:hypothetical protein